MGAKYSQLSLHERRLMFTWYHYDKKSMREIARRLRRSHTTISREIKRNISRCYVPTWYPNLAQVDYQIRIKDRGKRYKLKNPKTRAYIIEKIQCGWTPEIIAGRLKIEPNLSYVCHESIYQYIYKEQNNLIEYLPRHHKKRRKKYPKRKQKTSISNKCSILDRPENIGTRESFGHWETDSIVSPKHLPGCNVLVERQTRLTHITKLHSAKSNDTKNAIIQKLSLHPGKFVKSITYDNGSENAKHLIVNQMLSCESYFCQPYHSWEKGSVEQVNSLIRRYLPKKTDLTQVKPKDFLSIEQALNSRPRKCLGYLTPYEAYQRIIDQLSKDSKLKC